MAQRPGEGSGATAGSRLASTRPRSGTPASPVVGRTNGAAGDTPPYRSARAPGGRGSPASAPAAVYVAGRPSRPRHCPETHSSGDRWRWCRAGPRTAPPMGPIRPRTWHIAGPRAAAVHPISGDRRVPQHPDAMGHGGGCPCRLLPDPRFRQRAGALAAPLPFGPAPAGCPVGDAPAPFLCAPPRRAGPARRGESDAAGPAGRPSAPHAPHNGRGRQPRRRCCPAPDPRTPGGARR